MTSAQGRLGVEDLELFIWFPRLWSEFSFPCACFAFIKIIIPMITYKQFFILLFPEGSAAMAATDQSLLEMRHCNSFLAPSSQQSPPSAHSFNNGFLNIVFHFFPHYILFLWEDFTQTMTPIIANMLMTPSRLSSIRISLPSSKPADPRGSSQISTWMPSATQIVILKTRTIICLHQTYSSFYYT